MRRLVSRCSLFYARFCFNFMSIASVVLLFFMQAQKNISRQKSANKACSLGIACVRCVCDNSIRWNGYSIHLSNVLLLSSLFAFVFSFCSDHLGCIFCVNLLRYAFNAIIYINQIRRKLLLLFNLESELRREKSHKTSLISKIICLSMLISDRCRFFPLSIGWHRILNG